MKKELVCIISWGPVESLRNGHFIRVYNLLKLLSSITKRLLLFEYTEDLSKPQYYTTKPLTRLKTVKISLPGNETRHKLYLFKLFKFVLYQIINTIILVNLIDKCKYIIITGELFWASAMIIRFFRRGAIIIYDPQMLLYEREYKRGNLTLSILLKIFTKFEFKIANFIISISDEMTKMLITDLNIAKERVFTIIHTIPHELLPQQHCEKTTRDNIVRMAFFGSLTMRQNLEAALFLINALSFITKLINKPIELLLIGAISENELKTLTRAISLYNVEKYIKILGYVKDPSQVLCDADIFLAPMFTMSGVSTKMLYYLRFKDKIILASREAVEGIGTLSNNVVIANGPTDFIKKLLIVLNEYNKDNVNNK